MVFDREGIGRMLRIYRYPAFFAVTLFFFVVFLSFWQTTDFGYWLERLRIKVPFLVFPLIFLAFPRFSERQVDGLFYALLFLLTLTSIGVGVYYLLHAEAIDALMLQGRPMPTPRNHIRYSLLMAMGVIGGIWLYRKQFYWRYPVERKLIGLMTVFLFVFIHFLAVRSGLLTLYIALAVLLVRHIFWSRHYKSALVMLLVLFVLPVGAYFAFPPLQSKVAYMRYDLLMYKANEGALYADSGRIVSLKAGWDIWRQYPVFGVGAGNLGREVNREFRTKYPEFKQTLMPHNQFLFVAAGTGLAGLGLFCVALFYPLFYRKNYRNDLMLAFYTISLTAFMIEHSIENSLGVGFFVFFLTLFLNHLNRDRRPL